MKTTSILIPVGVGLGLGALFIALSHSSSRPLITPDVPPPKPGPVPAPKKPATPKTSPAPAPPPPGPRPAPPPPSQYMYPVGSVVRANVGRLGRREPGVQSVKIIKNRATGASGVLGDYEVIADDCFFPDSWCSSEWISQSDIESQ